MKLLKDIQLEAEKKNAKAKTAFKDKVADLGQDFFDGPKSAGSLSKPDVQPETRTSSGAKHKEAGAAKTRSASRSARINPEHMPAMNADEIDTTGEMSDEEAAVHAGHSSASATHIPATTSGHEPKPVTPNMLPAVISKALTTMGKSVANIEPEWHMVKHLPGYMSRQIRALGRQVFEPFTSTPIEDIQVLANLGGKGGGPNSTTEIDAVTRYITGHGKKDTSAELQFHRVLPKYSAKVAIYNCDAFTFFLVKDFAGAYIYSWPSGDSKELHGSMPAGLEHNSHSVEREMRQIERSAPKQLSHEPNWDDEG